MNDFVDINLSASGKIIPPKHNKIALIDADTLAYTACLNSEVPRPVMEQDYSESEWLYITTNPSFDSKNMVLYTLDLDMALKKAEDKLQRILDLSGCKTQELHFSRGKENFRYKIYKDYKGNRKKGRLPAGLNDLKKILAKKYNGFIHTKIEADDEVVYKMSNSLMLEKQEKKALNNLASKRSNIKNFGNKYYKTSIYIQWDNMLNRCYGKYTEDTKHYKLNNIKVYKPWVDNPLKFITWAKNNGWFEGCSIDRIDYFGHYIPSNIQFIEKKFNTIKQNLIDNPKTNIDFKHLLEIKEKRALNLTWKEILGKNYSEAKRSFYIKQLKNIQKKFNNELEYFKYKLGNNVKFKYNNIFYIVKNNNLEIYRNFILTAVDKDVINSIEGKHFYYYESNIYNKEMDWVTVSKEKSMKWKYIQTLAGDATDNIIGLDKIGLVKAEKLLSGIDYKDKQSIVNVLKREYAKQGRSYKDIILNLNLVDMSLYQGNPNTISLYKHIDKKLLKAKYEF